MLVGEGIVAWIGFLRWTAEELVGHRVVGHSFEKIVVRAVSPDCLMDARRDPAGAPRIASFLEMASCQRM